MTLTVEPAALTGYAQQLGRATDDAAAIKRPNAMTSPSWMFGLADTP